MTTLHSSPARLTVFGCQPDETAAFGELSRQLGVAAVTIDSRLDNATAARATGSRCISVDHRTRVTRSTLQRLRQCGVEYVSTRSAGRNHIDLDAARGLGMTVESASYSPDGVADYTLMLILMALRRARSTIVRVEAHDYRLGETRSPELRDLTVGVIGTGRIGSAVIERLQGFGCRVLAHGRRPTSAAPDDGLTEVLRHSDVVTLHTPLTDETRHLLDARRLALMKPGALLVNTGRGALVDTGALIGALESGRLGGAALDVLEDESFLYRDHGGLPPASEELRRLHRLPGVLVTPHTAYFTHRALADTVENTLRNCLTFERRHHG
jgi:D-specific alpha-keto acid dehydrogenase